MNINNEFIKDLYLAHIKVPLWGAIQGYKALRYFENNIGFDISGFDNKKLEKLWGDSMDYVLEMLIEEGFDDFHKLGYLVLVTEMLLWIRRDSNFDERIYPYCDNEIHKIESLICDSEYIYTGRIADRIVIERATEKYWDCVDFVESRNYEVETRH